MAMWLNIQEGWFWNMKKPTYVDTSIHAWSECLHSKIAVANAFTMKFKGLLGHNPYVSSLATQYNQRAT